MTSSRSDSPPPPEETPADSPILYAAHKHHAVPDGYRGGKDLRYAALTAAVYVLFLEIVARVPGGHIGMILATTLASLLFTLVFTVYMARALRTRFTVGFVG